MLGCSDVSAHGLSSYVPSRTSQVVRPKSHVPTSRRPNRVGGGGADRPPTRLGCWDVRMFLLMASRRTSQVVRPKSYVPSRTSQHPDVPTGWVVGVLTALPPG